LHRQEHESKAPPVIVWENDQNISHTKHNPTCVRTMVKDYPFTRPSPGTNPSIYPTFPALAWRGLPEGRIPKSNWFFPFIVDKVEKTNISTKRSRSSDSGQHHRSTSSTSSTLFVSEKKICWPSPCPVYWCFLLNITHILSNFTKFDHEYLSRWVWGGDEI
jgi:hypothetical protein